MSNALRTVSVATLVLLVHIALAAWLWQLPKAAKPETVQLISMDWVDTPDPLPPPPPPPEVPLPPLEPEVEPESVLVQNEPAPPPPEPPKPVPKPKTVKKPIEKKVPLEPVAQPPEPNTPVQEKVAETPPTPAVSKPRAQKAEADYLNNPKPSYPRISKRMGEQGEVRLKVQVSATGDVLAVELAKSSGFERLDEAAISAVKGWKFKAAKQGDEPVSSWVEVPVKFILEEA